MAAGSTKEIPMNLKTNILRTMQDAKWDQLTDEKSTVSPLVLETLQTSYTDAVTEIRMWIASQFDIRTDPTAQKIDTAAAYALELSPRFSNGFRTLISNYVHSDESPTRFDGMKHALFAPFEGYRKAEDEKALLRTLHALSYHFLEGENGSALYPLLSFMNTESERIGTIARIALTFARDEEYEYARAMCKLIPSDHRIPRANAQYLIESYVTFKGVFGTITDASVSAICDCKKAADTIRRSGSEEQLLNLFLLKFPMG